MDGSSTASSSPAGSSPPPMVPTDTRPSEISAAHGTIQPPGPDGGSFRPGTFSSRPGSERKRRLTTTSEEARQRQSSGDTAGPAPDDGGSSRSILPHRSVSLVLPSSRSRSSISAVPGSSFETAIDLSASSPAPARSFTSGEQAPRSPRQRSILPWVNQTRPNSSLPNSVTPQFRVVASPRWQADSEVSQCPICGTVFNFWHRKHHCRKCGRVVCASCSPHRITIPRQYIVRPPEFVDLESSPTPSRSSPVVDLTADDVVSSPSSTVNPALGGGEEVRLCNPCVPDPNPNPLGYNQVRPHGHRSTHSLSSPTTNTHRASSAQNQNYEARQERRTVGSHDRPQFLHNMSPQSRPTITMDELLRQDSQEGSGRSPRGGLPSQPPPDESEFYEARQGRRTVGSHGRPQFPGNMSPQSLPSTSMTALLRQNRSVSHRGGPPSQPPPDESEFCPVCRRRFPPLTPQTPLESRQAHIRDCIEGHLRPSGSPQMPDAQAGPPLPKPPPVSRMLPFVATEKDCLGEDGEVAECTICMEDYEVGQTLARLECLCKFHKHCIVDWFERKMECPVHKLS
ncbi:hypothetical protein N7461_001977 [Penicillium sp. DV-2018c]|nr:hypothetical protein N7461_001977 [Penicillium sp. DV-2018c]